MTIINTSLTNKFIETRTYLKPDDCYHCKQVGHHCGGFVHELAEKWKDHIIAFTYIEPMSVNAYEHDWTHDVDDIEDYYYNIPPVVVYEKTLKWNSNPYQLEVDGNHRVNTLQKLSLPIPVIIIDKDMPTFDEEKTRR